MMHPNQTSKLRCAWLLAAAATVASGPQAIAQEPAQQDSAQRDARSTASAHPIVEAIVAFETPAINARTEEFSSLIRTASAHRDRPAATLLLRQAASLLPWLDPAACAAQLKALVEGSQSGANPTHPELLRYAIRLRAQFLRRAGSHAQAFAIERPEAPQKLLAIGPFGDVGSGWAGVPFPPELHFPNQSEVLLGRFGAVSARSVQQVFPRVDVDLAVVGQDQPGCFYGLHQVVCKEPVIGFVRITTSGPFELFHDSASVAHIDRIEEWGANTRFIPVAFHTGLNHVLVKTTRQEQSTVHLAYVDSGGSTLPGIQQVDPDPTNIEYPARGQATEPPTDAPVFLTPLRDLEQIVAASTGAALEMGRVALTLMAFDQNRVALGYASLAALPTSPGDRTSKARVAIASAWRSAHSLPNEYMRQQVQQWIKPLLDQTTSHATVRRLHFEQLTASDQNEAAVRLLQTSIDAGTAGPRTYQRLHDVLVKLEFEAERNAALDQWLTASPYERQPVSMRIRDIERLGDYHALWEVVHPAWSRTPGDSTLARAVFDLAILREGPEAQEIAMRALDALHSQYSFDGETWQEGPGRLLDLGRAANAKGEVKLSGELFRAAAAHPFAAAIEQRSAAQDLELDGEIAQAIEIYENYLRRRPDDVGVRALLPRLRGEVTAAVEEFPHFASFRRSADELLAKFEAGEREDGAPSTLVYDQMLIEVFADGSTVTETHQIRRINDRRGIEQYESAGPPARASEVLLLRTITPSGEVAVPERVEGEFSMPKLEPGAFIEWVFRNYGEPQRPDPIRAPGFQFGSTTEPVVFAECVYVIPQEHNGTFRLRGFEGERRTVDLGDGHEARVFAARDLKRTPVERSTVAEQVLLAQVAFGEDAESVSKLHGRRDGLRRAAKSSPWIAAKATEICDGSTDDTARLEALYTFVQGEIADGNGSPTATLFRGQGDRFLLLLAMLRSADVPYSLATCAPTRDELRNDDAELFSEGPRETSYLVRVNPRGGEPVWIFKDVPRYWPMGRIPGPKMGISAVVFDPASQAMTRTQLPSGDWMADEALAFAGVCSIDSAGNARIVLRLTIEGIDGYQGTAFFRQQPERQRVVRARQTLSSMLAGFQVQKAAVADLEPGGKPLAFVGGLTHQGYARIEGNKAYMPLPLAQLQLSARYGDRGERKLPFVIGGPFAATFAIDIETPASMHLARLPEPFALDHSLVRAHVSTTRTAKGVRINASVRIRPGTIPATLHGAFVQSLGSIERAMEQDLVYVIESSDNAKGNSEPSATDRDSSDR